MKEWEKLENDFLKEIEPLVNEFFENKKTDVQDKQERENLYRIRREIRKKVESKVKPFVEKYMEMVNKEIKRLEEEAKHIREWKIEEVESLKQLRNKILKTEEAEKNAKAEKDEDAYQLLSLSKTQYKHEFEKRIQECNKQIRKHNSNLQEVKKLKDMLKEEFEMKYGDMKIVSENDMERLRMDTYLQEEKSEPIMKDGIVYYESAREMDTFGDFVDMQVNKQVLEYQKEIEDKQREQEAIKEKDKELVEIQKEIAQGVLDKTRQEFNEYLEQKMKEFEANLDEEIEEMQETKIQDDDKEKKNKGDSKKGKITLWQRFKSIFRKRNVPRLGDGEEKRQEIKNDNKFREGIKKDAPTLREQLNCTKWILGRNKAKTKTKEEQKLEEILAILD